MQVNIAGAAGFFTAKAATDSATPTEAEVISFPETVEVETKAKEANLKAMDTIIADWLTKLAGFKAPPPQLNNIKFPQGNPEAQDTQPIAGTKKQDGEGKTEAKEVSLSRGPRPWGAGLPWADIVPPDAVDSDQNWITLPVGGKPIPADTAPVAIWPGQAQDTDWPPSADTTPVTLPVMRKPVYEGAPNVDATPFDGAWEATPRPSPSAASETTPAAPADTTPIVPVVGKKPVRSKPAESTGGAIDTVPQTAPSALDKASFRALWQDFRTRITQLDGSAVEKLRDVVTKAINSGVPMREIAKIVSGEFIKMSNSVKNADSFAGHVGKIVSLIEQLAETTPKDNAMLWQNGFAGINKKISEKITEAFAKLGTTKPVETTKETKPEPKPIQTLPTSSQQTNELAVDKTPNFKFEPSKVMQRVVDQIQSLIESKRSRSITLRLDPPELGSLQISIKTVGNQVETRIMATNGDVRSMVENGKEQLIQMLSSRGLELGSMFVGTQQQNRNQSFRNAASDTTPTWRPEKAIDTVKSIGFNRAAYGLDLSV